MLVNLVQSACAVAQSTHRALAKTRAAPQARRASCRTATASSGRWARRGHRAAGNLQPVPLTVIHHGRCGL
jgi:hypothetical protein